MYYGLIILSTIIFGGCFAIQDVFRRVRGASGTKMTFESTFVGGLTGTVVLLIFNGTNIIVNPFVVLMAFLATVNGFVFTYCSFMALTKINLSLFSLFSMLGGMMLPFLQGIIFYDEPITVDKIVCVIFICAALAFTLDFGKKENGVERKKSGGLIYYVGIFALNGMSGVLAKIFSEVSVAGFISDGITDKKVLESMSNQAAAGYSVIHTAMSALIAGVILFTVFRKKEENEKKYTWQAAVLSGTTGSLNKIANFILAIAIMHVDASVQYPMVTGGVMIVSTAAAYLTENKPKAKELISVGLAFIGMLALFVIPLLTK
jgi:drug/metabolite transporter (DMT)-like permease